MSRGNNRAVALREFQQTVEERRADFSNALPAHIPVARFERVVMTAIQNNLQLLDAPRRELFNACVKAAQDGLLPDGREGALVCRPSRNGVTVTWQPMIAGIRKKVRNSGEIATWDVQAVHENDAFEFELGDEPFIKHRPALKDRGELIAVYSVATLKSGEKSRDVMSVDDVNRIRDRSDAWRAYKAGKIKSTPWATDYAEMAKKTVARRHAKVLPMSTDLDDLIRRDDALYNFEGEGDAVAKDITPQRKSIAAKLDALAGPDDDDGDVIDAETGEVIEDEKAEEKPKADKRQKKPENEGEMRVRDGEEFKRRVEARERGEDPDEDDELAERAAMILADIGHAPRGIDADDPRQVVAYSEGLAAYVEGAKRRDVPAGYSKAEAVAWQRGYDFAATEAEQGEE